MGLPVRSRGKPKARLNLSRRATRRHVLKRRSAINLRSHLVKTIRQVVFLWRHGPAEGIHLAASNRSSEGNV